MKYTTLLLFFVFVLPARAQVKTEEVFSQKLNANRTIRVITPPSYNQDKNKKYPLLLLLDGEYMLEPFAGTLAYAYYWDELPETVIVAVNTNDGDQREADMLINDATGLPEGTGDKFFQFIGDELIPALNKKYRLSPFRIIAGHDLTARMADFYLYKENTPFRGYINFSPEIAEEMETRLPEMADKLANPVFFYLCSADGDVPRLKKRIKELDEKLKVIKNPNFRYAYDEYTNGSHYSLIPFGVPGALYGIFTSYRPISPIEYQEKIVTLPNGYVDYLKNKYNIIEKDLGTEMTIRLTDFKAIEAAIMKNTMYAELKDLAALAKKNYPKKIIGEYYEALYYEMMGDYKKAKKVYMNSYSMDAVGEYTKDFMIARADKL
ncbi:alpha/beta hydrolase [Flavobacterium psychrotrophum]|uniref:alpha/beta hydrolase n=1 Tax=Flavobacterium psychrotrophum TaxID=2294119 RepID=UPI000E321651|nr:alpha/beta hydrolase-fold protein [Flavobacterium psychrotrophum]